MGAPSARRVGRPTRSPDLRFVDRTHGDVSAGFATLARARGTVALDIETSGLAFDQAEIGTIQLFVPDGHGALIQGAGNARPARLAALLDDPAVTIVIHYALFDLSFLCHHWQLRDVQRIADTKICAKLLREPSTSLQPLLAKYLGVHVEKGAVRTSNWLAEDLTDEQVEYAMEDVRHLPALLDPLEAELARRGLLDLARACFRRIPDQVQQKTTGTRDHPADLQALHERLAQLGYRGIFEY